LERISAKSLSAGQKTKGNPFSLPKPRSAWYPLIHGLWPHSPFKAALNAEIRSHQNMHKTHFSKVLMRAQFPIKIII